MKTTSGSVTDYCGNFIYADNQLIIIFAGDVRIAPVNFGNSTYWKYEYSMKDHLGNTRVVFAAHSYGQPELLQQTSYYPFGMTMQQQNFYSQNTTENKYLYNSKELQDDQLAGNTCYLPNKGTEFSHLSWPRGEYGDVPGDGEEFMGGGSHTPFLESRKKTKKVVEKKVEQGDFNNFDLFDFYVSSFETPGMSFNVQIHPDIDGEETEEKKKPAGQGDGFNWGIPIGAAGTAISAGTEYADNLVRTSFKTGRNPVSWSKLTPKQQAWRTANVLGKNAKYVKYAKGAGVIGTGISVGMAGRDIYMGEGTTIDYFDVGVGTASIGAAIFLASNPVGWVIGAGAAVYFAGRLVYDIYEEVND